MHRFRILPSLLAACCATALLAQAPSSAPKPDHKLKKLAVLVGHWTYEGEYKPGPLGPGAKIKGAYDAHMILGGFFLQEEQVEKVMPAKCGISRSNPTTQPTRTLTAGGINPMVRR